MDDEKLELSDAEWVEITNSISSFIESYRKLALEYNIRFSDDIKEKLINGFGTQKILEYCIIKTIKARKEKEEIKLREEEALVRKNFEESFFGNLKNLLGDL